MFEAELKEKLSSIFAIDKVSYNLPSDSKEQEVLFVEIESTKNVIKDTRVKAMVTGHAVYFGKNNELPFGYFSKKIKQADKDLTRNLFFFDIETNTRTYQNLVQRGFSFIYFFDSEYDPNQGSITSIDIIEES